MTSRLRRYGLLAALPIVLASCADAQPAGSASSAPARTASSTSAAATATAADPASCPAVDGSAPKKQEFSAPPPMCIDPAKTYTVTMETDAGPITLQLDAKKAPKTVNNFVVLARQHYYDGVPFHRVIPGFVIQGGDPQGTGAGGPGYRFEDELPQAGEYKVGSLAMANAGRDTNGSQFFIVTGQRGAALPPQYTLFGQVTAGMETVKKIEADGSPEGTPATLHRMTKVTVAQK